MSVAMGEGHCDTDQRSIFHLMVYLHIGQGVACAHCFHNYLMLCIYLFGCAVW